MTDTSKPIPPPPAPRAPAPLERFAPAAPMPTRLLYIVMVTATVPEAMPDFLMFSHLPSSLEVCAEIKRLHPKSPNAAQAVAAALDDLPPHLIASMEIDARDGQPASIVRRRGGMIVSLFARLYPV